MKKYLYIYFNIGTCRIHYEEKIPWVQTFFWSSAIARMEWNGMTDIIPIIPIIDPLSDRTGTATVPECKWVVSEWWIKWLYKWWKSVLYKNPSWVWGLDRKIRPKDYEAWRVMSDDKRWSRGTDFSIPSSHK